MAINWNEIKEDVIELYTKDKLSLRQIAGLIGTTHSTVNKYLSRWGVARRSGVNRRRKNTKDLVGQRFGHLTVLAQDSTKYPTHWLCKCICNRRISVSRVKLIRGWKKSCGCRQYKLRKK